MTARPGRLAHAASGSAEPRIDCALTRATVGGVADQNYAVLAGFLFSVVLVALVIPAPERPPRHEAGLHLALLFVGAGLAIIAGVLALAHLPVHSAACGALAWLTVMPCFVDGARTAAGAGPWLLRG
jgi:hypothetical protein